MEAKSITTWRKMTVISADGIKETIDVQAFGSNYAAELDHYMAFCKASKCRFVYLSKTIYNQYGEKIKNS